MIEQQHHLNPVLLEHLALKEGKKCQDKLRDLVEMIRGDELVEVLTRLVQLSHEAHQYTHVPTLGDVKEVM